MGKTTVKPPTPPLEPKPKRIPAQDLLLDFLKKNKIDFAVRKQSVRYLEDKGILIEPPVIIVYYRDQIDQANQPQANEPKIDKNGPSKT